MTHKLPCNNCRQPRFTMSHTYRTMPQTVENKVREIKEILCGYCGELIKRESEDVTQE